MVERFCLTHELNPIDFACLHVSVPGNSKSGAISQRTSMPTFVN